MVFQWKWKGMRRLVVHIRVKKGQKSDIKT